MSIEAVGRIASLGKTEISPSGTEPQGGVASSFGQSLMKLVESVEQSGAEANTAVSNMLDKEMVDHVAHSSPRLIEDLIPKLISLGEIQRVLRQLLRERVPIRDLPTILEAIADAAIVTKDPDAVTEAVRGAIGRAICRPYQTDKGELPVIGVAPVLEERLLASLVRTEQGSILALDPQQAQNIATRIARALEQAVAQPVLLCSPTLRPHLWRLFARVLPHLGVLSHNEVPAHIPVVSVATLD